MPGDDIRFYGTTGPGGTFDGDAESNPDNYLGRFRSSTLLHELQSSLTVGQNTQSRHIIVDSARIGDGADAHVFKWVLMSTGTNALSAGRVMAFDDATGTFKLDRRLGPGNALFGHQYTLFPRNNVFPNVSEAQAAAGDTRFRCIAMRNEHGFTFTNFRVFFVDLMTSGIEFASINQAETPLGGPFISRADGVTDVLNSLGQRFPNPSLPLEDQFRSSSTWWRALADSQAVLPSTGLALDVGNLFAVGIWLRRTMPAAIRFRRSIAFMLIAISDVGGSSPDPLAGGVIISFDIEGETPVPTLTVDRPVHIAGGARLNGSVLTPSGVPIVNRPVRFAVKPGDEGIIVTSNDPTTDFETTDENGEAVGTFKSTSNPAFEGDLTHPQMIVGAGDEVGNP